MRNGVLARSTSRGGRVSVYSSLWAGFELCVRKPVSVFAWGVLLECGALIAAPRGGQPKASHGAPSVSIAVQTPPHLKPAASSFDDGGLLLAVLSLAFLTVAICAAYRAILRPKERSFAYLRVGPVEALLTLYTLAWVIWPFAGPILGGWVAVAGIGAGIKAHSAGGEWLIYLGLLIAWVGILVGPLATIWALVRLSLLGPMAVDLGRIPLGDAWRGTKGHFWTLFGMVIGVWVIVAIWLALSDLPFRLLGLNWKPALTPNYLAAFVVFAISAGVGLSILAAPWARLYRNLTGPDVASTFE